VNNLTGAEIVGSTDDFTIISRGGGAVARVQEKFHIDSQGQVTLDKSTCQAPV
jgi:hypothetical protein